MKKHPLTPKLIARIKKIQERHDCTFSEAASILSRRRRRSRSSVKPTKTPPRPYWWQD